MKILGTLFFWLFLFSLMPVESRAAEQTTSFLLAPLEIKTSLNQFKTLQLEQSRAWQKLIHRERNMFGLKTIQVTDKKFFLSNELPQFSELEATFVSFFADPKAFEKTIDAPTVKLRALNSKMTDHSDHAICRFPARLKFLKQSLESDVWKKLPKVECVYQKIFLEAMDPQSVSFVFSSYYSDSPGSAFGHTFFRINRIKNNLVQKQELLDYGIGYAANVTTSNGALYALLGLVGGFTGSWTNLPYYYKVREYNDFEARDLWSYDLNLTKDEVDMLVAHFWEVGAHYYSYYFFTQNCAFHMLTVLEAAAPRLHLTDHVPFYYVIPSDSMKALFYEPGLVSNVSFRPSLRHVFLERSKGLSSDSKQMLRQLTLTKDSKMFAQIPDEKDRALALDAALDLIDLQNPALKEAETVEEKNNLKLKESLLLQRAQIDFISPDLSIKLDSLEDPSQSHGSSRASLTYFEKNKIRTGFFEYRFALHDLLDPAQGLPKNSQLEFFTLNFQLKPNELKFQSGQLFKVFNLNPLNFFERKLSWGVELGVQNNSKYCDPTEYACYLTGVKGRFGYSYNLAGLESADLQTTIWAMGSVNARHGNNLLNNKKVYFAPGYELGFHHRFSNSQALLATFGREYPIDYDYDQFYEVQYRVSFRQKLAISAMVVSDTYGAGINYFY
jgi:hypothetical protein